MNPIVLIKKIKSEERPIHKESYRNTEIQIQKESIFSTSSVPHILSDIQNTTDVIIINGNKNYIQRLKSLDDISLSNPTINHISNDNIKNINLSDINSDHEIKEKEDFEENLVNYLWKKININIKSIQKFDKSNLFKTYIFDKANGINEGRWSFDEHIKFIEGIILFKKNWFKVAKYVGTRGKEQARSHSRYFYLKLKKIKNNKFNVNFQNRNTKNIFDIIYLLKERNKSNNDEKEYLKNALIYLTKSSKVIRNANKKKIKNKKNYIINANGKKIINNSTKATKDSTKANKNKNNFFIFKVNHKLNDNNNKEKEKKTSFDNKNKLQ